MKDLESVLPDAAQDRQPVSSTVLQPGLPKAERYAYGKSLRIKCPRNLHAVWKPSPDRQDPVVTTLRAEEGRIERLLPLRHERMAQSPFTFYRGSALIMAADLAITPSPGVYVQACGDAHLCNFGGFATPERNVIFSINDLDETLPAPWEWDMKRLAASFAIACRNNGITDSAARDIIRFCVRSYRENMVQFSEMRILELWYYRLTSEMMISTIKDTKIRERALKRVEKEKSRSIAEEIFPGIAKGEDGSMVIRDQLPEIFHWDGHAPGEVNEALRETFQLYKQSIPHAYSSLLDRYTLKDAAIKVVGIGSVGTSCWVLFFLSSDGDRLFLQAKEARPSVLEPFAGNSVFDNCGQRVVNGYRLMQPYSDPFLGWTRGPTGRCHYLRQLRDVKISIRVDMLDKQGMKTYADWCGKALALSHARSGNSAILSGYMGKGDAFDKAITDFSFSYADQNERDYQAFRNAIREGKVRTEA